MTDWRFGDVLRLSTPAFGYENIRIMYLGERQDVFGEEKRIIWAVYVRQGSHVSRRGMNAGDTSSFYGDAYEDADGR